MNGTAITAEPAVARGAAFGLIARLLGEDVTPLADLTGLEELGPALDQAGSPDAGGALSRLSRLGTLDPRALGRRRVRLFDQGRVSPHETSYVPVGAGGHTSVLADIAGFYRAFGMKVTGERPDHVMAELEFASLATLAEHHHRSEGRIDAADNCAEALASFLGEHLGCWLERLAARLVSVDPEGPYGAVVEVAARFVSDECRRRGVVPMRPSGLFLTAQGPMGDEAADDELPTCGAEVT